MWLFILKTLRGTGEGYGVEKNSMCPGPEALGTSE